MGASFRKTFGRWMYRIAVSLRGEASVFSRIAELKRLEFVPQDRLLLRQREALTDVLRRKLPQIPFYREWWGLGAEATMEDVLDRLRELPVLEKEVLQDRPNSLKVENWRGRSYTKTTGGSTGRPVTLEKNPEALAQEMAATWLGYGWFGVQIGDPSVRFWGQPAGNLRRRIRYRAADAAMNRVTLSAFGYTPSTLDRYSKEIERFRPRFLYGYVSALEELARHVLKKGASVAEVDLKCVITTSEVLSEPQRAVIEEAFGAPVQNEYGCGEVGPVAYECPEGSLHVMATNQFVELLDDNDDPVGVGGPGSVVITDLTNEVMPLIRYRLGDKASWGRDCGCGRSFPVLDNIFGREYDVVESSDGRRFHGEFFMYLFEDLRKDHPSIGQFKVIQIGPDELVVRLVVSGGDPTDARTAVARELRRRLPGFSSRVERVETIERQPSGKMRVVENRLEQSDAGEQTIP